MRFHYTEQYLLNPAHRVTVDLIGLGGTGSQVLTMLGRMSAALIKLGHPGLHVRGWDPDTVEESNVGRQLFSPAEIGMNKAVALMNRINRFFGTDWEAWPFPYCEPQGFDIKRKGSNITITCVDTIAARVTVTEALESVAIIERLGEPHYRPYYWLDFGNTQKTGQVVLGTVQEIRQPKNLSEGNEAVSVLPHVFKRFPELHHQKDEDSGPSCSLAEALSKQDLFINSTLCNLGMALLWKLFREFRITHHGAFLNLETLTSNPIKI